VGRSPALAVVLHQVSQVAETDAPVLVLGETGTGKDLVARAIHDRSRRRHRPLVTVNCAALPAALIESELFGYERGAFTGALARTPGRFEVADGGTILLDEVGELPLEVQAKLLRVLQSGEFERLGSSETQQVDVRVLAATNADLREAMRRGAFRADLYFRLNVIELGVPPLRERPEDVLPLAEAFLRQFAVPGQPPRRLSPEARAALVGHSWPGNVRELANRVQRATLVAAGSELGPGDLGLGASAGLPAPGDLSSPGEREELEQLLVETGGRVSHAAERLGLSRQALYRRMERLGITLERRPKR
jgi:transcriptional regulator with GAF, ATPase, and Fis domain